MTRPDAAGSGNGAAPARNGSRSATDGMPETAGSGTTACRPELLAALRDGAWLDRQQFPPLRYHVPGIIPEGATLLVGPPKVGKSWLTLSIALAVAAGGNVLGLAVDRRPVLLLALEDGDRRLQSRCRTLLADGSPIPPGLEYLTAIQPMAVIETIDAWLRRQLDDAPPLVILDTLGKVMPPSVIGESAYQRDYRVGGALKRLADGIPGAALVINHHDRKADSDDFVDRVSGTNGLAGSADTIVVIARQRHEADGVLSVTGRDVAEGQYAVRFDGSTGLWMLQGSGLAEAAALAAARQASDGLDGRARAIVTYIAQHPEGVKASSIAQAIGIDAGQARQYLTRLYEGDRIIKLDRGLYAPKRDTRDNAVAFEKERLTSDDSRNATLATPLPVDGEDGA